MKKSGGVTFPNSEDNSFVAVTVIYDEEGNEVEKVTNQSGEIIYEADEGGGGD